MSRLSASAFIMVPGSRDPGALAGAFAKRGQRQEGGCSICGSAIVLWCFLFIGTACLRMTPRTDWPGELPGQEMANRRMHPHHTMPKIRQADICADDLLDSRWAEICVDGRLATVNDGRKRGAGDAAWGVAPSANWTAEGAKRRVRDAFLHAWDAYKAHAWGHDELRPASKTYKTFSGMDMGLTVVDAMDTALVMGLEEPYRQARRWVAQELDFDWVAGNTSFFEVTIRYLGGLLSTYYLTGDGLFLSKAVDLGDRLAVAFDTPTGLPAPEVDLKGRKPASTGGPFSLAEVGSCQLEMAALSSLTGNATYGRLAEAAQDAVLSTPSYNGLKQTSLRGGTLKQYGGYTLGGRADSWYEYLLKRYLQSRSLGEPDGEAVKYREAYATAVRGIRDTLVRRTGHGWTYLASLTSGKGDVRNMEHLACFAPGMLALGTTTDIDGKGVEETVVLARELTKTCYAFYRTSRTGLSPESVTFAVDPAKDLSYSKSPSILRPETVESLFVLHRVTGDPKYRQWGMDIFDGWEQYARIEGGGYSSLSDVSRPGNFRDEQESFFLAESLKYLYLLFDDSGVIPLKEWVFNTEAHPLSLDPAWSPLVGRRKFRELMSQN